MRHEDQLVEQLARLCLSEGGVERVAATAGVSSENLKQILRGTKLPSGNPRSVGPSLRKKLDDHFPGWRERPEQAGYDKLFSFQQVTTSERLEPHTGLVTYASNSLISPPELRVFLRSFARSIEGASPLLVTTLSNALSQLVESSAQQNSAATDEAIELIVLSLQTKLRDPDAAPLQSILSKAR